MECGRLPLAISLRLVNSAPLNRAVAQLGSALEWGSRGRGFESRRPEKMVLGSARVSRVGDGVSRSRTFLKG